MKHMELHPSGQYYVDAHLLPYARISVVMNMLRRPDIELLERQGKLRLSQERANMGTRFHKTMTAKRIRPDRAALDMKEYQESYRLFARRHGVKRYEKERIVYSEQYRYAGRPDTRFFAFEKRILGDYKTGPFRWEHGVKMCAYEFASREMGLPPSDELWGIQVFANGQAAKVIRVPYEPSIFLQLLAPYRKWKEAYQAFQ